MGRKKIRFAVVGHGHIGRRHAQVILESNEAELVAICDVRPADELDAPTDIPFYTSLEKLLANARDLDIVCICTPNGLHVKQTITVLRAGANVLCEKPLGINASDCRMVIDIAKEEDKEVFCVMQNRYSPPSAWIKEVVRSQVLGEIYLVQLNCYWNRDGRYYRKDDWRGTKEMDGGTLFTQFSHFIDTLYWLFGDIENITSRFFDFNHSDLTEFEDSGIVTFDLTNGGSGVISYSTAVWDANMESSLTIIAEKGSVKISGQYMDRVEHCHIENYVMPPLSPSGPPNDYGGFKGSAANHAIVINNVIDRLRGGVAEITTSADGLRVVEMIERVYGRVK